MIQNGANVNAVQNDKRTPLHLSSQHGIFVHRNRHFNQINRQLQIFHLFLGLEHVSNVLLRNRANVYAQDKDLWTPLHLAACNGTFIHLKKQSVI